MGVEMLASLAEAAKIAATEQGDRHETLLRPEQTLLQLPSLGGRCLFAIDIL